jgi:PTH1 family peptidyl-tRNA hydrolase
MRFLFGGFDLSSARRRRASRPDGDAHAERSSRFLIVGLGNPGPEHAGNRHNVGFWCLNEVAKRAGMSFRRHGKLASLAEGTLAGREVILAKPQTFVNRSGDAVRDLVRRNGIDPRKVIVVYDELDLPVGALRIREQGSHGGQNGMRSIIAALGTQEFPRVRIGIGRPSAGGEPTRDPEHVAAYVLSNPPVEERRILNSAVGRAADAIELLLGQGVDSAMAQFNSVRE